MVSNTELKTLKTINVVKGNFEMQKIHVVHLYFTDLIFMSFAAILSVNKTLRIFWGKKTL